MTALVWLAIPAVALVLATLWVAWIGRTRPRADTHETVEAHQRFVAAFEARRAADSASRSTSSASRSVDTQRRSA